MRQMQFTTIYKGLALTLLGLACCEAALAATDGVVTQATTLGGIAHNITAQFKDIGKMMIGLAYLSGIGFGIGAVFKFKQHKDNPTQIPIGTPFALLTISVLLVFLPGIYTPAGRSLFGSGVEHTAGGFFGGGAEGLPGYDDPSASGS